MPYASNQGVRIHYKVEGDGPPLVLQHGYTQNLERWYQCEYVDALKSHYQLILIDARGHGASDKPHDSMVYAWPVGVMDVVAVLEDLNIQQTLFWGYSMGGGIGFGLAKHAPDRVKALVIGGASANASVLGTALRHVDGSDPEAFVSAFEALLGVHLVPEYRAMLLASDTRALSAAAQDRPSMEGILPNMTMPCLIYIGEADANFSEAQANVKQMPHASFVSLPGLHHAEAFMRADLVSPHVTKFLQIASESVPPNDA